MQTYKRYEVVVSDDSPDNSVEELTHKYSRLRIKYYRNNPSAGTPENWNLAIHKSSGDWIKLMHDDDWFAGSDSLELFAKMAKNEKTDFAFSACTYIHDSGSSNLALASKDELNEFENDHLYLLYDNLIGHPSTTIYKRDDHIDYNTHYKWLVDIEFYLSYLIRHGDFTYIPQPIINIGTGGSQVSAECYKNPNVEIPEYLDLISSVGANDLRNKYVYFCIWNLVKKFRLKSVEQVQDYYDGPVPEVLKEIINFQKKIPGIVLKQTPWSSFLMKRSFSKMNV